MVCSDAAVAKWAREPIEIGLDGHPWPRLTEYLHAEGQADAVLHVLRARGVDVSEEAEARILSCKDTNTLTTWVRRAATADTIDDVFS